MKLRSLLLCLFGCASLAPLVCSLPRAKTDGSSTTTRDKRALGILLQGFMEALGYTVTPIQLASLPVGVPSAPMPAPMPAPRPNATAAPARQRETVRITGVLNFGNNVNTSDLVNHLAQYERIFHGANNNASSPASAPAPSPPPPAINPRAREPYLVQLPLPPAQQDAKGESEECRTNEYEEDEGNASRQAEDYERQEEEEEGEGEDRDETPDEKVREKVYRKNESVENYSLENRELHGPAEVSRVISSKYGHGREPSWRREHEVHLGSMLAKQNAARDADADFHRSREKEIDELNEDSERRHHYDEDDDGEEEEGESRVSEATRKRQNGPVVLRDSYGRKLEKPGGQFDERVAGYVTMFKNPRTGLYDPQKARDLGRRDETSIIASLTSLQPRGFRKSKPSASGVVTGHSSHQVKAPPPKKSAKASARPKKAKVKGPTPTYVEEDGVWLVPAELDEPSLDDIGSLRFRDYRSKEDVTRQLRPRGSIKKLSRTHRLLN